MKSGNKPEQKFWQVALADLERELGTDAKGLTTSEAALRRLRYGPNALEEWAFYRRWSPVGAVPAPLIRAQLPLLERS